MAKTVLIIDDDDNLQAIYRAVLTRRGYSVLSASHGAEGVHLGRQGRPHLILLDMRMPVMSGWIALEYLRTYEETRAIPVCGMSAYPSDSAPDGVLSPHTFDAFLSKPITPNDLTAKAEELIGPP